MKGTLGSRLKEAREGKRLTQMQAAKILEISNGTLSGYERDYRDPDTNILKKIAALYDVSIDWLTGVEKKEYTREEKAAYLVDVASKPGTGERNEFVEMFIEEFNKLPEEIQKNLFNIIKEMPKKT